jgi:hypothetical protein
MTTLYAPYRHNGVVRLRLGISTTAPAYQLLLDNKTARLLKPVTSADMQIVIAWVKNDAPGSDYPAFPMVDSDHGASGDFGKLAATFAKLAKIGRLAPLDFLAAVESWAPLRYFDAQLSAWILASAGAPRTGHPCWKLGNTGLRAIAPNMAGVVKLAADYEEAKRGFMPNEYTAWLKEGAPTSIAPDDGSTGLDCIFRDRWIAA